MDEALPAGKARLETAGEPSEGDLNHLPMARAKIRCDHASAGRGWVLEEWGGPLPYVLGSSTSQQPIRCGDCDPISSDDEKDSDS